MRDRWGRPIRESARYQLSQFEIDSARWKRADRRFVGWLIVAIGWTLLALALFLAL